MMDLLFTASSFFFTDTATSQRYTLSLHDALPISVIDQVNSLPLGAVRVSEEFIKSDPLRPKHWRKLRKNVRSEEHTSELQSRGHLVCRLLLEKKNNSCCSPVSM